MQTLEHLKFKIAIDAPVARVWDAMIGEDTYRQWTKPFHAGSHYKGSWEKGAEIQFLAPDEKGALGGMASRIHDRKEHEFISIEHYGFIAGGVVDTTSEAVKAWTPSFENYYFEASDGGTLLTVTISVPESYKKMFDDMWPAALAELKKISEN